MNPRLEPSSKQEFGLIYAQCELKASKIRAENQQIGLKCKKHSAALDRRLELLTKKIGAVRLDFSRTRAEVQRSLSTNLQAVWVLPMLEKVLTEETLLIRPNESKMARRTREFSSVVNKEGKWYVATCPELGVTSQGKTVEESIDNLREAIELYLEDEDARVPASNYRPLVTVVKVG